MIALQDLGQRQQASGSPNEIHLSFHKLIDNRIVEVSRKTGCILISNEIGSGVVDTATKRYRELSVSGGVPAEEAGITGTQQTEPLRPADGYPQTSAMHVLPIRPLGTRLQGVQARSSGYW